jgi:Gram-negative bacterial TonB protein C-terminal
MGRALHLRSSVVVAVIAHTMVLSFIVLASRAYVAPIRWSAPAAPLPPPAPAPPAQITDPRVFRGMPLVYSSLPLRLSGNSSALFTDVVKGVGIFFPPLPDIGTIDRRKNPIRRVWPGQGLEDNIIRRVLPEYPFGAREREAVSVFLEYLIGTDGAVRVLRTSGPPPFAKAARSAVERWQFKPVEFEDGIVEVISRVEVRFDGELANAEDSTRQ